MECGKRLECGPKWYRFFFFSFTSLLLLVPSLSFTSMFPSPIFVQCLECWSHHWFCFVSPLLSGEDPGAWPYFAPLLSADGRRPIRSSERGRGGQMLEPFLFCPCCVSTAGQVFPESPGGLPQSLIKFKLSRAGTDIERLLESWPRPSFNDGDSQCL